MVLLLVMAVAVAMGVPCQPIRHGRAFREGYLRAAGVEHLGAGGATLPVAFAADSLLATGTVVAAVAVQLQVIKDAGS
jgi:hypothetical protein